MFFSKIRKSLGWCLNITCVVVLCPVLPAAISLSDSSGIYDVNNWYGYRSNSNVAFSGSENSINFSKIDNGGYVWGYFNPVALEIGETLTWSGTLTVGKIAKEGVLSLGIFNSGPSPVQSMVTHTYQSNTDVSMMPNYKEDANVISTVFGGMTGLSANSKNAYLRSKPSNTAFLSTSGGAQQETVAFSSAFSTISENSAYDFSLSLTKTDAGMTFAVAYGDTEAQIISFDTDIDTFDVLGIRSPVTASSAGITLSNLSLTTTGVVIPEPASASVLMGFAVLGLLGVKRRRNHEARLK